MKQNLLTIVVGILLVLIFGMLLFSFQVRQSEVAVVTWFGAPTRTEDKPGWKGRLPWPIERVYKFDQRIQNFEDRLDESQTSDHFSLLTEVYVGWKISDPQAFLPRFANGSIPEAERTLEGLVRSAKAAVVGKHRLSDFVSADASQIKFAQIESEILEIVQDQVKGKKYGMEMAYLGFKKLEFPESVTKEVFNRMSSERAVLFNQTLSDGEKTATNIVTFANSKSAELLANADAAATRIKAQGQQAAASSFTVFQQNPELAIFLQKLKTLEASTKEKTTLIFDQNSAPFDLFQGLSTNSVNRK